MAQPHSKQPACGPRQQIWIMHLHVDPLAAKLQAIRQHNVAALEDDAANANVGTCALVPELGHQTLWILAHQLDEYRIGGSAVSQAH